MNVLNINDLANAVKPVVLPGEEMKSCDQRLERTQSRHCLFR